MKNKILLLIILLIYILFPILILFNSYLYDIKFYLLTGIGLLVFILMKLFGVKNKDLGLTKNNLFKSIKRNIILILLFVVAIIVFKYFHIDKYKPTETIYFYIFYILVSCPLQEFLYRGVFGYFEKVMKNKYIWIIISSICYSFVHIIYRDWLTLLLTFIIGIIWYILYRKDYNLVGVSLSHIVLGILTIALGIIN
ncbi:MAG: CPBP family intramembrane metalloprotease [Bacilli bacterium]|nr:CPBP family intramembrane metalloprotease [Bacilli bacterium]